MSPYKKTDLFEELTWEQIDTFNDQWLQIELDPSGFLEIHEAQEKMLQFAAKAYELGRMVAQATYWTEHCRQETKKYFNMAFTRQKQAGVKTDKAAEFSAKADMLVERWEEKSIEAQAIQIMVKNFYDSAVLCHHACKSILRDKSNERFIGEG